jgi:predicted DNA-binding transcriptional regulator AlpA
MPDTTIKTNEPTHNTAGEDVLIRLPEVLRIIPVSKSTWWKGIKDGRFPEGRKFGSRITAWSRNEVLSLCYGTCGSESGAPCL